MANRNGFQDRSLRSAGMMNSVREQDLQYSIIGYVRDSQSPSRSSPAGNVSNSLLSSLSGLNLLSPEASPYPSEQQLRRQSTYQTGYFDGAGQGLLENEQLPFVGVPHLSQSALLNHHYNRIMDEAADPRSIPISSQRSLQQNPYRMNPLRPAAEDQFSLFNRDDQSLYNMNDRWETTSNPYFPMLQSSTSQLYNFNRVDSVLGHNVQNVGHHSFSSGNRHRRHVRDITSLPLTDLRGIIMSCAKDQQLCRVLQHKFLFPTEEEIEMVVSEVIDHLEDLMTDQYGNYLFQKLIDVCSEDQLSRIIFRLCSPPVQLVPTCLNVHGSRSVQKLLLRIYKPELISMIISVLAPGTLELATDSQGHHVLQQCFKLFRSEDNEELTRAMTENCFPIATNKSGCVALHICIVQSNGPAKTRLLTEIVEQALHLAEDPYGNYVVQHALDQKIPQVNESIVGQLKGNFFTFSRSKFASNVVEKCMANTAPELAEQIILELITNPNISLLLVDPFGNFVTQSAFEASTGQVRAKFIEVIRHNLPILRSNLYGKKIVQMMERNRIRLDKIRC